MPKLLATYSDQFRRVLGELKGLNLQPKRGDTGAEIAQRVEHMAVSGGGVSARDFERSMGRNDLLRINYLERGMMAAQTVCRIRVADAFGGGGEWGTGFLVSPRLLVTNNHVISSADDALRAVAEFGYEANAKGLLRQGKRFQFAPELEFITSPESELDFTLVALAEKSEDGSASLSNYGFLRLDPKLHKVGEGEFVTIIQHPSGDEKYIAIRENKVLKIGDQSEVILDNFLWYASDTAPGSSGAPAFNDQWQVVAVHHRGVPETRERSGLVEYQLITEDWVAKEIAEQLPDDKIKWIANEGVRTSKIVAKISELHVAPGAAHSQLVQDFLDDATGVRAFPGTSPRESIWSPTVTLVHAAESAVDVFALERARTPQRNVRPLSYYDGRQGYVEDFLGVKISLPQLTSKALHFGSPAQVQGTPDNVLRYTHFSVLFNVTRRIAFFTAVNIDGKSWLNLNREDDQWYYDPRLQPMDLQIGDELYGHEPARFNPKGWFDRGHLVRRLDPVWGTMQTAALANDDTFHWANCSPQYWGFNQGQELWQGLENFILYNTDQENVRANVFTGPLFQDDDEEHRGILIPQYFWKVVVVSDGGGKLYSSAYVVSQKKYAQSIPFERLPVGDFNHFQVAITKLEQRTGLDFQDLVRNADVLTGNTNDRPLRSFSDIVHPRR